MFTAVPLQMVAVDALVIAGTGLTVTVTVCAAPTHPPVVPVGVTVYVTVSVAPDMFVSVLFSVEVDCSVVLSPVTFTFEAAIQV